MSNQIHLVMLTLTRSLVCGSDLCFMMFTSLMLCYTVCLDVHVIVKTTDGYCVCSVTIFVCDGCSCSPVFLKCLHSNLGLLRPRFNIFMYRLRWVALLSLNLCLFHPAGNERTSYCSTSYGSSLLKIMQHHFYNHLMFFSWLCGK